MRKGWSINRVATLYGSKAKLLSCTQYKVSLSSHQQRIWKWGGALSTLQEAGSSHTGLWNWFPEQCMNTSKGQMHLGSEEKQKWTFNYRRHQAPLRTGGFTHSQGDILGDPACHFNTVSTLGSWGSSENKPQDAMIEFLRQKSQ